MTLDIGLAEKKAGQDAARKLREEVKRRMYEMVSMGQSKNDKEDSLASTTVKALLEKDGTGLDALKINIPRHGLILSSGWDAKGTGRRYQYPFLEKALYDSPVIETLASELAGIRGDYVVETLVRGFKRK